MRHCWKKIILSTVLKAFSKSIFRKTLLGLPAFRWHHCRAVYASFRTKGCATLICKGSNNWEACSWDSLQRHLLTSLRQVSQTAMGLIPHLVFSGIIWSDLQASGIILKHLDPSGTIWSHPKSSGPIWNHLESSGGTWNHLE